MVGPMSFTAVTSGKETDSPIRMVGPLILLSYIVTVLGPRTRRIYASNFFDCFSRMDILDVIIIGGGWGGICTLKHCLEENLRTIILEKSNDYGGVWNINNTPSVYANTYSVTSKYYLSMTDFPMPESYPEFPHHTLVIEYMRNYVKHFDLERHISLNSEVTHMSKKDGLWHIGYKNSNKQVQLVSKNIAICTGQNSKCVNYPDINTSYFQGKIYHAVEYDDQIKNLCLNKRVLIYGGSDTAFDIGVELANNMYSKKRLQNGKTEFGYTGPKDSINSKKTIIYVSMQKGRWIQRRTLGAYEPADMLYSRIYDSIFKNISKSLVYPVFIPMLELFWGKTGSGIPEWETEAGYLNSYYVKSAEILPKVTFGDIIPLKKVVSIDKTSILTVDKKTYEIDVIIFATGYNGISCFTFIPENIKKGDFYDHIFLIDDSTVAKVGFIRPYLTSIPMIIEMQSRYVAKVFANRVSLPNASEKQIAYNAMKKRQDVEFGYDNTRITGIIDPYDYMNMIANKINVAPSLSSLLFKDPLLLYFILFHTWSHFVFRLNDPNSKKRSIAREQILILQKNGTSKQINFYSLIILLCIIFTVFVIVVFFLYTPNKSVIVPIKKFIGRVFTRFRI